MESRDWRKSIRVGNKGSGTESALITIKKNETCRLIDTHNPLNFYILTAIPDSELSSF